jgi:hypothetical protein
MRIIAPTVFFFLTSAFVFGQIGSASSGPPAPEMSRTPPETSLPIDSGLVILLIVGLVYGIYMVTFKTRVKNNPA